MSTHDPVQDLLHRWEELAAAGNWVTAEELCRDCPEHLDAVRKGIRALAGMQQRLDSASGAELRESSPRSSQNQPPGGSSKSRCLGTEPVPGYQLMERLGQGGFSEVWKATGPGGLQLALKFVPLADRGAGGELRALQLLKDIHHPNLLTVFTAWQVAGDLIVAMELAEETLADCLRRAVSRGAEGIPLPELLEYMQDAAQGIDYLNQPRNTSGVKELLGIQHRDIKPHNLLLVGGRVKVADFGLARFLEHHLTAHSGSMTPAYAAPEFFRKQTSNQSDQYSLAVTYCHLRGGRLPFTGNAAQMMAGHLTGKADLTMLPKAERPVVARALSKNPRLRWPSCRAFVEGLTRASRGSSEDSPAKGRWYIIVTGGAVLTVALGLARIALYKSDIEQDPIAQAPSGRGQEAPIKPEEQPPQKGSASLSNGGTPNVVYLADLKEQKVWVDVADWFRKNGTVPGREYNDLPIELDGTRSPHALFMHPSDFTPANVLYRLDQDYASFVAIVTIPRAAPYQEEPSSPVSFEVLGNGRPLWKSKLLRAIGEREAAKVPMQGIHELELRTYCQGRNGFAWATWIEPRLLLTESTVPDAVKSETSMPVLFLPGQDPVGTQKQIATQRGWEVRTVNSIGMQLMLLPPGEFWMGSPVGETGRHTDEFRHRVQITKPYYLGMYEVTQREYDAVMGYNPARFNVPIRPVERVSWHDAVKFCEKLSRKDGARYRLPTEAEWEYAYRAGTTTTFPWGTTFRSGHGHVTGSGTNAVGNSLPNRFGLYDMNGNVMEWCADWYGEHYYKQSPPSDPTGPESGTERVLRGSGWFDGPGVQGGSSTKCRSAYRMHEPAERKWDRICFRVVREVE